MLPSSHDRPLVVEVVDPAVAAILRQKTGAERLQIASDMVASARRMLRHHLLAEHPDWDEAGLEREVTRRLCHRSQ